MNRALAAWRRFWFAPEPAHALAAVRIALCAYMVVVMLRYDVGRLRIASRRPLEMMDPSPFLDLIPLPFPMPGAYIVLFGYAMALLGVMACVGLLTRPALLLFGIGYLYTAAAISAWGYVPHSRIVPVQTLFVLAVAPGSTAWSLDRLLAWAWRQRRGAASAVTPLRTALEGPPVARWGKQVLAVTLAAVMLSAGISKLRHSGWQWADGQTLGYYLSGELAWDIVAAREAGLEGPMHTGRGGQPPDMAWKDGVGLDGYLYRAVGTRIGRGVARSDAMVMALASSSLLFELAAPLLLFGRRARSLYLLGMAGFFTGIRLTMGINFFPWVLVGLCLVDWRWVATPLLALARRARLLPAPARPAASPG